MMKPACLIAGGFFIVLLQGCSLAPLQSDSLLENRPKEYSTPVEITSTPFNPQREYECGPASLATVLQSGGLQVTDTELVPQVYLPARKGSLQIEMLATTRRYNRVPYIIDRKMEALLKEVKSGNPVLVMQNLGLASFPRWHYAVVIGYDMDNDKIILRSGEIKRHTNSFSLFERTWRRANYWGFVALENTQLPASGNAFSYLRSVSAFEKLGKNAFALRAYQAALKKWPGDTNLLMAAGNSSYATGKVKQAEKYYRAVITKSPAYAPALNNLAHILYETRRYREAEKLILKAISLDDKYKTQYQQTLKSIRQKRSR